MIDAVSGFEKIEQLQAHPDMDIHKKAVKILETYFGGYLCMIRAFENDYFDDVLMLNGMDSNNNNTTNSNNNNNPTTNNNITNNNTNTNKGTSRADTSLASFSPLYRQDDKYYPISFGVNALECFNF